MTLEIITPWYNEEFLAPLFLRHYASADIITLLYDSETTDATRDIAAAFPNVRIVPFTFPHKLDNALLQDLINSVYRQSACDYVMGIDADEFAFYVDENGGLNGDIGAFTRMHPEYDVFHIRLHSVYPRKDDVPIDRNLPPVPQRRHGDPMVAPGYRKPALLRAGLNAQWWIGRHQLIVPQGAAMPSVSPFDLMGAHWNKADKSFAIPRILRDRVNRLSVNDIKRNFSTQYYYATEKSLLDEFAAHENDPQIF